MSEWRRLQEALRGAVRHFGADHCANHAAAISFFALLSLFPLILLAVFAIAAVFGAGEEHVQWIAGILQRSGGRLDPEVLASLERASQVRGSHVLPLALTLIYSASQVFASLQRANRQIFRSAGAGGFLRARLRSLMLAISLVGALVALFGLHQLARAVAAWSRALTRGVPATPLLMSLAGRAVPLALAFLLFSALYRALPEGKIGRRPALIGGALVALAWEGLKLGFGAYVAAVPRFGLIYGPLATLIVFLVWIYLVSCIFLLGGELVAILNGNRGPFDRVRSAC